MGKTKKKITAVSLLHYFRLVYRSILFVLLLLSYIQYRIHVKDGLANQIEKYPLIIYVVTIIFVVEMIFRFFPSKLESPGCQKQFKQNYIKSGNTNIEIADNNSAMLVLIVWIVFNMAFGALHMVGIFDDGIMILLCSAYSVCDMICILFFCPFQTWFMKNKCCSVCRIYNWDYVMMFTPLFFVTKGYCWILLSLSIALLLRWEIIFFLHPERFSENTNDYLKCSNCSEKLCAHKKQLISLWEDVEEFKNERLKRMSK